MFLCQKKLVLSGEIMSIDKVGSKGELFPPKKLRENNSKGRTKSLVQNSVTFPYSKEFCIVFLCSWIFYKNLNYSFSLLKKTIRKAN